MLSGAFVVDAPGAVADDRVFVIDEWLDCGGRRPAHRAASHRAVPPTAVPPTTTAPGRASRGPSSRTPAAPT